MEVGNMFDFLVHTFLCLFFSSSPSELILFYFNTPVMFVCGNSFRT